MKANGKALAVLGGCLVTAASSATVVFDLDTLISGSLPTGTAPFLRAEFQNQGTDTVRLTMTNLMPTSNFVDNWLFNVDFAGTLGFSYVSGVTAISAANGSNFSNGGSNMQAGWFDVEFHYPTAEQGRFHGGLTSIYDITGTGLTEDKFLFLSQPDLPHSNGGYYSAAHVQGFPTGAGSGSIGTVPEPVSGLLLMSIGFVAARKRRKA